MKYRQVLLIQNNTRLTCWVEDDKRLKKGVEITLKEIPGVTWIIETISDTVIDKLQRRTWKVGGL